MPLAWRQSKQGFSYRVAWWQAYQLHKRNREPNSGQLVYTLVQNKNTEVMAKSITLSLCSDASKAQVTKELIYRFLVILIDSSKPM